MATNAVSPPGTLIITGINTNTTFPASILPVFLENNLANIALLGNSASHLEKVKRDILSSPSKQSINLHTFEVDITSAHSVGIVSHKIRAELGAWDVFIHCATSEVLSSNANANVSPATTVRGGDEDEWWASFERNVRSLHHIARHFFTKMRVDAAFLNLLTYAVNGSCSDKESAGVASSIAAAKVIEYLAKENDGNGFRIMNVVIGKEDVSANRGRHLSELLAWCVSNEARFLSGRTVEASSSVEDLLRRKNLVEKDPNSLTIGLVSLGVPPTKVSVEPTSSQGAVQRDPELRARALLRMDDI